MKRNPYTYLIGWSTVDLWYYGVRYAQNCHPDDLWKSYFTSSTHVKKIRLKHGDPDIIEVRKIFDNANDAIRWETKVLTRMNVINEDRWLNKNINGRMISGPGQLNPMYGKTHSLETIKKLQIAAKDKRGGHYNGMYGKTHTSEVRQLLRNSATGKNNPQFEGFFITPWGKFESAPLAANACPVSIRSWTLLRWCKNGNDKTVTHGGIQKSKFLTGDMFGKTFADLGFGFERIKNDN